MNRRIVCLLLLGTFVFTPEAEAAPRSIFDVLFGKPRPRRRVYHRRRGHETRREASVAAPVEAPPVDCAKINEGVGELQRLDQERFQRALRSATEKQRRTIRDCAKEQQP